MKTNEVNLLRNITVKIITKISSSSKKVGTGFFINKNTIVTCFHTIEGYEEIKIEFQDKTFQLKKLLQDEKLDIACLQIKEEHDTYLILSDKWELSITCYSFGFPRDFEKGSSLTYKFEGYSEDNNQKLLKLKDGQFESGFSGSAVLNLSTGKICGMICETRGVKNDLGGYAIPIETIINFLRNNDIDFNKENATTIEIEKLKDLLSIETEDYNYENLVFFCNKLSKKYKNTDYFLKDISINLYYGEITLLVGKNGSGKTTLLEIIASKLQPSNNKISLYYPEIFIPANTHSLYYLNKKIAYIPQEPKEIKGKVIENLLYTTVYYQNLYGQEAIKETDKIIDYFNIRQYIDKKYNELSTGYKLRFLLAKAILQKPKLIVLDEPLANLDIGMKNIFLKDLKQIIKLLNNKVSIIFTSHNIQEAEMIADNLLVLQDGDLIYNGKLCNYKTERIYNIFELSIECSIEQLEKVLDKYLKKIRNYDYKYIIFTSINIEPNMIIEKLVNAKLQIGYFRDITFSSSIVLEEQHE